MSRSSRLVVKVYLNGIGWRGLRSLSGPASIPRKCGAWKELQGGCPSLSLPSWLAVPFLAGLCGQTGASQAVLPRALAPVGCQPGWQFPVDYFTFNYSELLVAQSESMEWPVLLGAVLRSKLGPNTSTLHSFLIVCWDTIQNLLNSNTILLLAVIPEGCHRYLWYQSSE